MLKIYVNKNVKMGKSRNYLSWIIILALLAMAILTPKAVLAESVRACGDADTKTGKVYKGKGSGINVRVGPGINFSKIINQKATRILKKTHYVTIDTSVTVYEECVQGVWSKIRVTKPDYLSQSHRGWVMSKFLRAKKTNSSGVEVFMEADFLFDKNTQPYKKTIISGVNKIHRENPRCKNIDPSSAYISSSKGSKLKPVFFVTCGSGYKAFNVFFSNSGVLNY